MLVLLGACFLLGCDPLGRSHYIWKNDSDHTITLLGFGYGISFENEVIPPGESFITDYGELGGGGVPPDIWRMTVTFDNDIEMICGSPLIPVENRVPGVNFDTSFNPMWEENYEYKKLGRYDYQWTYTFTNADYEAAVRMSEGE